MKIGTIYRKEWRLGNQVDHKLAASTYYLYLILGDGATPIDLVLTLGGDGTILHASSLFKTGAVPPVLSFSMGTLGFLLPFRTWLPCCRLAANVH